MGCAPVVGNQWYTVHNKNVNNFTILCPTHVVMVINTIHWSIQILCVYSVYSKLLPNQSTVVSHRSVSLTERCEHISQETPGRLVPHFINSKVMFKDRRENELRLSERRQGPEPLEERSGFFHVSHFKKCINVERVMSSRPATACNSCDGLLSSLCVSARWLQTINISALEMYIYMYLTFPSHLCTLFYNNEYNGGGSQLLGCGPVLVMGHLCFHHRPKKILLFEPY